jgi:hypothetical protein
LHRKRGVFDAETGCVFCKYFEGNQTSFDNVPAFNMEKVVYTTKSHEITGLCVMKVLSQIFQAFLSVNLAQHQVSTFDDIVGYLE